MQKITHWQRAVAAMSLVLLAWLTPQAASASHALGSDMSYVQVAPDLYLVTYRFYRDCSGIPAPPDFPISCEGTGCGPGNQTNSFSESLLYRSYSTANPYCRQQNLSSICDSAQGIPSNGRPNYQIFTYSGTISLRTSGAPDCTEWIVSASLNARPNTQNLGFGTDLYTEIRFNNKAAPNDESPLFSIVGGLQPLAIMYSNTPVRYNGGVTDSDGDSIAYQLVRPLSAPNTPIPYINGHSLTAPIRLQAGSAPIRLDQIGNLQFTPGSRLPNTQDDEGNKFVVAIQAESWRRINGSYRKICTIRREVAALYSSMIGLQKMGSFLYI
jgi:hypothetical protein